MVRPSSRRWSAFSVRPPSDGRTVVSTSVSARNAAASRARRAAGSWGMSSNEVARPDQMRVGHLAGAPGGLARVGEPAASAARADAGHARSPVADTGGWAGQEDRGRAFADALIGGGHAHGSRHPTARTRRTGWRGTDPPRSAMAGRPRARSAPRIRSPPAGWTSTSSSRPSAVTSASSPPGEHQVARRRARRPRRSPTTAQPSTRRRPSARSRNVPGHGRRPGPGARARRPAAPGRGARPRAGTAA